MDDETPKPRDTRVVAIILAVVAAVALIVAGSSKSWLANPNIGELRFGPLGAYSCDISDHCEARSNGEFVAWYRAAVSGIGEDEAARQTSSSAFAPLGYVTFGACVIGALGLLAAAALAFRRARPELPIAPTTVALLGLFGALIAGCVFVATKPGPAGMVGAAWGFWVFGIAVVAGIASSQMLARLLRPRDPDEPTEPADQVG